MPNYTSLRLNWEGLALTAKNNWLSSPLGGTAVPQNECIPYFVTGKNGGLL